MKVSGLKQSEHFYKAFITNGNLHVKYRAAKSAFLIDSRCAVESTAGTMIGCWEPVLFIERQNIVGHSRFGIGIEDSFLARESLI